MKPQAKQHSAYRSPSAVIEYLWHPLHGKELRVCRRSGRCAVGRLSRRPIEAVAPWRSNGTIRLTTASTFALAVDDA
jgi:hypothetical protein